MADYWVDDGGDNSTGTSWATAYTTIGAAQTAGVLTAANRIFIGDSHTQTQASALTIVGPTSGLPCPLISCDQTDNAAVPAYKVATADQFITTGANAITFDGSFALYGLQVKAGDNIALSNDSDEMLFATGCTFKPASNRSVSGSTASGSYTRLVNNIIDCIADTAGDKTAGVLIGCAGGYIDGLTVSNAANRTAPFTSCLAHEYSGIDVSGVKSAATIFSITTASSYQAFANNVKTPATFTFATTATTTPGTAITGVNVGSADAPESLFHYSGLGNIQSVTSKYRNSGAAVETVTVAWECDTGTVCSESTPFYSPWIYGTLSTTGSKTFSVAIAHTDQGGGTGSKLMNSEIWLEAEYMGTSNSPLYTLGSSHRVITATPADWATDGTSTWTGSPGTDLQTLSVTGTVNESEGLYRVRVVFGKASLANVYVDPKVTVT